MESIVPVRRRYESTVSQIAAEAVGNTYNPTAAFVAIPSPLTTKEVSANLNNLGIGVFQRRHILLILHESISKFLGFFLRLQFFWHSKTNTSFLMIYCSEQDIPPAETMKLLPVVVQLCDANGRGKEAKIRIGESVGRPDGGQQTAEAFFAPPTEWELATKIPVV